MKIVKIMCVALLLLSLTSTAYAGVSQAFGLATVIGDNARAFSVGYGDGIALGSIAAAEDTVVVAQASGRVVGDRTGSSAFTNSGHVDGINFAEAGAFVQGTGNTYGFTWASADR